LNSLGLDDIAPEAVQKLDSVAHKEDLKRVGAAVAKAKVKAAHFTHFLQH
jgi:hypothetical protein